MPFQLRASARTAHAPPASTEMEMPSPAVAAMMAPSAEQVMVRQSLAPAASRLIQFVPPSAEVKMLPEVTDAITRWPSVEQATAIKFPVKVPAMDALPQ